MKIGFKNRAITAVTILLLLCLSGCGTLTPTPTATPKPIATATSTPVPVSTETGVVYKNTQYGFSVDLPESWKGYSVLEKVWQGTALEDRSKSYSGPEILIRNPAWTEKEPTQDIPILIFTLDEWKGLSEDKFHIGAAPINPSELARNSKYIFALPARYNYAFPKGYEEVEKILARKPVKPIENN